MKYPDDIQIVGVLSRFAPDSGDPLSMQIWVKNKELAVEAGWKKEDTTEIDVALLKAKKISDGIDGLKKGIGDATQVELDAHWVKLQSTLEELGQAFRNYQPKTIEDNLFGRFVQYLSELADAAAQRARELTEEIAMRIKGIEREEKGRKTLLLEGGKLKDALVQAEKSLVDCMPTDDDDTGALAAEKISTYFKSGEGKKLLESVAMSAKASVLLQPMADFATKAINLGIMKSSKDPVQVAGHINETVQRLKQCESQIENALSA